MELPREGGVAVSKAATSTPGPWVTGAFGEQKMLVQLLNAEESEEVIVESVGLLPVKSMTWNKQGGEALGPGKICPIL